MPHASRCVLRLGATDCDAAAFGSPREVNPFAPPHSGHANDGAPPTPRDELQMLHRQVRSRCVALWSRLVVGRWPHVARTVLCSVSATRCACVFAFGIGAALAARCVIRYAVRAWRRRRTDRRRGPCAECRSVPDTRGCGRQVGACCGAVLTCYRLADGWITLRLWRGGTCGSKCLLGCSTTDETRTRSTWGQTKPEHKHHGCPRERLRALVTMARPFTVQPSGESRGVCRRPFGILS